MQGTLGLQHHVGHLAPQTSKGLLEVSTLLARVTRQGDADFERAFVCTRPEWSACLFCSLSGKPLARVSKDPCQKYILMSCKAGSRICRLVYSICIDFGDVPDKASDKQ